MIMGSGLLSVYSRHKKNLKTFERELRRIWVLGPGHSPAYGTDDHTSDRECRTALASIEPLAVCNPPLT